MFEPDEFPAGQAPSSSSRGSVAGWGGRGGGVKGFEGLKVNVFEAR